MPLPVAPIAAFALRYGGVALAAWAATRQFSSGRRDQRAEDAFDETPEGLTARRDTEQMNATGRMRRVIRWGDGGPALEIDATALGRLRIRRL